MSAALDAVALCAVIAALWAMLLIAPGMDAAIAEWRMQ